MGQLTSHYCTHCPKIKDGANENANELKEACNKWETNERD